MFYEILFAAFACVLTLLAIGLIARSLLKSRDDKVAEDYQSQENLELLSLQYDDLLALKESKAISAKTFEARKDELIAEALNEARSEKRESTKAARSVAPTTAWVLLAVIPMMTIGLYLTYGDYSSLNEKAIDQMASIKAQAESQKSMQQTVVDLEAAVKKNPDELSAWEVLAEHYNETGSLEQARIAYENVVRLSAKNAKALSELADIVVALEGLTSQASSYCDRALQIDPWNQKALMIRAAKAYDDKDYKLAVMYFERLRKELPQGSEVVQALSHNIKVAMEFGGLKELPEDPVDKIRRDIKMPTIEDKK